MQGFHFDRAISADTDMLFDLAAPGTWGRADRFPRRPSISSVQRGGRGPGLFRPTLNAYKETEERMIAPLAKFIDWSAIQTACAVVGLNKPKWKLQEADEFLWVFGLSIYHQRHYSCGTI